MEREIQKAALVAVRSTKRQLKEKRIRDDIDDDQRISGADFIDTTKEAHNSVFVMVNL